MRRLCQSTRYTETVHAQVCGREEGHLGPCSFADGNGAHVWLDGYEIANLKAALDAIREARLYPLMNGDWFEQLRSKLQQHYLPFNQPNMSAADLADKLQGMLRERDD
jgi:hypothetical protein